MSRADSSEDWEGKSPVTLICVTVLHIHCSRINNPPAPDLRAEWEPSPSVPEHVFDKCTCERTGFAPGWCWAGLGRAGWGAAPGTWVLTGCWGRGGLYTTGVPSGLRNGWPAKGKENKHSQLHHLSWEKIDKCIYSRQNEKNNKTEK